MKKLRKILSVLALIVLVGSDFLTSFSYALDDMLEDSVVVQTENEEETESVETEEEKIDGEDGEDAYEDEGIKEENIGEAEEGVTGDIVEEGTGELLEMGSGELEELTGYVVEGITGDIEELTGSVDKSTEIGEEIVVEDITYNEELIIGEKTYNDVTVRVEALSGIFPEGTELRIEPIKWGKLSTLKDKLVEEKEEIEEDTTIVAFDITFKYEGEEVQPKDGEKVKVTFDYSQNEDLVKADKNENQEVKVYHIEDKDEEGNKVAQGEEKIVDVTNKQESAESGIAVADADSFSVYVLSLSKEDTLRALDTVEVTHYPNAGVSYTLNGNKNFTAGTITITDGTNTITILDRNLGATAAGIGCKGSSCQSTDSTYGYYFQWGNNYGFDPKSTRSTSYTQVETSSLNYDPLHQQYFSSSTFIIGNANWLNDNSVVDLWGGSVDDKSSSYPLAQSDAAKRRGPCPENFHVPSYGELNQILSMMGDSVENTRSELLIPFAGRTRDGVEFKILGTYAYLWSSSPYFKVYNPTNTESRLFHIYDGGMSIITFDRVEATPIRCFYDFYQPYTPSSNITQTGAFTSNIIHATNNGMVTTVSGNTVDGLPTTITVIENDILESPEGEELSDAEGKELVGDVTIDFGGDAIFSHLVQVKIPVTGSSKAYVKVKHVGSDEYNYDGLTTNTEASCNDGNIENSNDMYHGEYMNVESGYVSIYTCRASDFAAFGLPKVTFEPDNGSGAIVVEIESGVTVNSEDIPTVTKDGYNFSGWYLTGAESAFDFSGTAITGNITLYAKWQEDEGVKYTVTFDANRGTFANLPDPQTVASGSLIYAPDQQHIPELPGYTFTGWYTAAKNGTKWNFAEDAVTQDITLYAHWEYNYDVGDLDVYIVSSTGKISKYVMMDRNVGADEIYNQDFTAQNTGSFGYVYQWGNNRGFNRCRGNGTTCHGAGTPNPDKSTSKVPKLIWQEYYNSKYASGTWIAVGEKVSYLDGFGTDANLWGHETNGYDAKQGPCPDGYYVPTKTEFNEIILEWGSVYKTVKGYNITTANGFRDEPIEYFTHDFLFPLAGAHRKGQLTDSEQGGCAEYWTSVPAGTNNVSNVFFCKNGVNTYYDKSENGKYDSSGTTNNSNGSTVRCFKNTTGTANLNIVMSGGNSAVITVNKFNGVNTIVALTEPKKTDRVFGGWYTSPTFESNTMKTGGDTLSASETTLYAKWNCPEGLVYNVNNQCVSGVLVRFMDGETEYTRSVVLSGEKVSAPVTNPNKEGYIFTGWFESGANSPFVFTETPITGNLDLYAHWDININKYDVNVSVLTGDEGYLSGMGSAGISLTGLYDYGTELVFIAIPELGYVFDYWMNGDQVLSGTDLGDGRNQLTIVVDQILNIIAFFKSEDDTPTPYTVEHYQQNLGLTGYDFVWSGIMYGTANEQTNATGTNYEGFTLSGNLSNYQTGIKADGSTVVRLYYNRDAYTVTFENWNGDFLWSGKVANGEMPTYGGSTPTRASTQQSVYTFDGWYPELSPVTGDTTYTATYTESPRLYTVTLTGTPAGYGTLSPESLSGEYETAIVISGSQLTIGGTEVILTGNEGYEFQEWTGTCGQTTKQVCDEFIVYSHPDPIEFTGGNNIVINSKGYDLFSQSGFQKDFEISFDILSLNLKGSSKQATLLSVKNEDLNNVWPGLSFRRETTTSNLELTIRGGSVGPVAKAYNGSDVHSVKISRENGKLYIAINGGNKEKVYDFAGFTNYFDKPITIGSIYQNGGYDRYIKATLSNILIKTIDTTSCHTGNVYVVTGDCQMTAKFKEIEEHPKVTVNHHWMNIGGSGYTIHETEYFSGNIGDEFTAIENEYIGFTANPNNEKTIIISGDNNSNVIDLYYYRDWGWIHFSPDPFKSVREIITSGCENSTCWYGEDIQLTVVEESGYTFNSWGYPYGISLPEGVDRTSKTISFTMPEMTQQQIKWSLSLSAIPYTITYHLNGGEETTHNQTGYTVQNPIIEVTDPVMTGYEFLGWTGGIIGGEQLDSPITGLVIVVDDGVGNIKLGNREYYANWTQNKYTVTGSVATGQENMGYLSGSISTGASLTGLYDFGTNLIFIAIPELGYVFDYWKNGDTILSGTDLGDGTNQLTVIVDQILDIIAFFKPAENTPYTVEHYKQNLTQDGYEFAWSGTMYGTTNESTNATGTDYEGFTLSGSLVSYQTGINADGSTVVRLYYDRNTYTVMWDMWEGYPSWTVKKFDVIYGSHPVFEWDDVDQYTPKRGRDPRTDDIKYDFTFTGWVKSGSSEIIKDLTTQIVTGDVRYVAQYDTGYRYYEVRYHTDEGTGTMEPQSLQLYSSGTLNKNKFIRTGYIFSGWWYEYSDGIEVFYEDEQEINLGVEDGVLKSGGEWEDPLYLDVYARWKPSTDTKVTVNYYLKDLDKENNVLIDSRTEYAIGVEFTGTTDSVIDSILTRYGTGINGYEYSKSIVYGTDYPSGVETGTTTILADGSRKIDMYYVPSIYQFTLNSESHSSTAGSSESTGYYYGANVKLSGDSNDDCFEWSGWTTSGITLSDNMSHQTWFAMPANDVEATPSTTENTYNIIFNGNESTSGEMSPMNGVRCAESTGLILNVFEKSGHTFTGWSTIVGGSIDYTNGGTVSRLSTGDGSNVTLYAVWDINKYNVNASVLSGNEGYLSGMGSTGISLTGLYDYATELVFIAIPELGYVFDYWKNGDTVLSGTDLGDGTNQLTVVVDQILDIIAFFKPAENTPYIVEHYKQNLSQDGYEFAWSGTMYGTTNELTNATGSDYEGFTLSGDLVNYQTGIKADGSTVVKLYYDRNVYTITWNNRNGSEITTTPAVYGNHPEFARDGWPQRYRADQEVEYLFIFTGWSRSGSSEIIRELTGLTTEIVTGDTTYIAQYDQIYRFFEVRYHPNGGTGNMGNQVLQLNTSGTLVPNLFTRTGYEFSGWLYSNVEEGIQNFYENGQEVNLGRMDGVDGDREGETLLYIDLYAQWKASSGTKVTVNYYLKNLDADNNVLIDTITEYATGVEFTGNTDDVVDILSRYGTGINGYEYSKSIVYGTDYPSGVETGTTTILADGSRKIDMYYVPVQKQFTLNSVTHTSTAGSSQNGLYYYGAKVILSGDINDDCFTWSGWTTSGITLSNVTLNQTWFDMPANDVEATPSTTENTYNIIFNGNGSNSGTMSPMNGVRCTESIQLTPNAFGRDGYTFTGWSTTAGGSRKYTDGVIVDRLSTGVDVNLYAVWDVNHYTVTFDLNGGNLTGDMTETKDYTIETSSISLIDYEPERNGYTFTGWYRNDILVNSIAGGETGDYTLVARWEAQRRPVPVVVYKKMLIPGEWSEYESELMWGWGTVGELYTAPLENFTPTGFHYEEENDSNRRTVVVDPDLRNEVAIFFARNLYPVIINNAGEGRSSDTSGSSDYLYEEPVTISVTPYTGWEFINWTLIQGTLSGITDWTQRTLSFNMPAEQVMISPILDHIPYTVSFDTASGTTVENQTYYYDDILSGLNSAITTRTGYNFDGWYLSGVLYTSGSTMPAENITLTAKWAPCTGIQYQVNHRGENTGDNNYEVLLSGYIMYGTSDTQTIAKSEEFAGFTLSGNVEQKAINPNGTTEVNIYYNRNVYTISLDNNGGTGVSEITGKYQSAIAKPDDPNRLGYNFAGWDPSIPDTMPVNGGESTAKWNPGLTQYTVNYHIEKVQTGEYDIYTGVYAGETDSSPWIPLLNPSLTGFITPAQFTGKIIPGGTEFDYYYDRDSYMLYYDTAGGTPIPGKSFRYGEKILTGETQRPGYTLIKWNNIPEDGNMPAQSGLTLVALREPDAHTKYTVYHYFESLSGGYVTGNVQPLSGTTDTLTTARPISVPGYKTDFDIGDEEHTGGQVNIDGDGNAHVEIYYDRIVYQIVFDMNGGDAIQGTGVKFGTYIKSFIDSLNPHKKGYAFSGWNPEFPTAMPDRSLTGIAMWTPATGEYKVEFYYQRADGTYSSTATREELRTGKTEWVGRVKNSDKEPSIAGYAFDSTNTGNVLEGQIVGDGSLVLKLYFKKQFTVKYLTGLHGTFSEDVHSNLDYGVGTPVFRGSTGSHDSGYTFLGWDPELTGVVVEDRDYIAQWKADSDTEFKVEYYLQNVEDDGYTFAETGLQTGTTNTTGYADTTKEFTGFIFSGGNQNNITSGLIAGDGSLVLKLYYDRKEYNVTIGEVEYGTMEGETGSQRYGKRIIFTAHPDAGYVISKWLRDGNEILSGGVIWTGEELEIEVDTGMEIGVEFKAKEDTPYYVEYYKENLEGGYEVWTGTYSGTTDQEAVAQELSFTGFTYDSGDERNERTGNIDGDGSRVLRLYYTRNTNNVVYVYTGKVPSGQVVPETTGYKYEANVTVAEVPSVPGYNFSWSTGVSSFTMPDEKIVITGTWTANTGTKYAVQHMLQNIEDDGYTQTGEDQIFSGETDELTNAQANNYTGFTVQSFSQTGIKGDESTIVVIKYDRNEYEVTTGEVEHGTMEGGAGSQRYGKRIIFTAHPDAGYVISKWLRDGNEILSGGVIWTGEELEIEVDTGMEIGVEFKAKEDTPYYVEYYKENLEGGYEVWTGTYSGTTDQEAVAQELSFTGFTFSGGNQSNITSGVIAGDGSLVLKLFYDRNKYTITWKDGNDEVLKTDQLFYGAMPEYTGETPTKIATAQYSYTFNNTWAPAIESVTTGVTYTAQFDVEVNKYLITFVDGDGKIVQSGMVVYGEMPQYTGTTPTKTATAQYSYTFNNTWAPAIESVTTGVTYTAQFDSTVNEYTISIVPSDTDMGTVSPSEINVSYGSTIVESGNIITVGGVEVKATPKSADVQYTYEFDSWTNTCGSELIGTCTIQANFRKILNKYSITWMNDDGSLIDTTMVAYGVIPTHAKPTKTETEEYRYVFVGWDPEVVAVVGDAEYTAVFNAEEKEKHSEGGNMSGGGGRKSTIDNAENSDNQHGSAEENSDLFTGGYYVSSGNVDEEILSLYEWAHENDITTIDTLEEANADGYLTRGHMAKIAVNFAEKILGKTVPDVYPDECNWNDKESERESQEIKVYAKKACALGVMGINVEEFMPNKILNRAEFGTTVSRLLWGDKYNIIDTDHRFYYEDHLYELKKQGIMTQINDPEARRELRKWVRLVFRRITEKIKK